MDKSDADSLASVNMKEPIPELATITRSYSVTSEPPPYKKPVSNSVRIARLIAVTVVAVAAILGAAIILAAYIQSRHAVELFQQQQQHLIEKSALQVQAPQVQTTPAPVVTELPSALTGDGMELTSDEAPDASEEEDKGHRRLDTEPDMLEEFLEEQGKILRLPVDTDDMPNFNDLTEMLLGGIKPANTKCFVQRKPIGGGLDDVIKFPIKANSTAMPILARLTGERISVVCQNSDEFGSNMLPFDMPAPSPMMFRGPIAIPLGRFDSVPFMTHGSAMPQVHSMPRPFASLPPQGPPSSRWAELDRLLNMPPAHLRPIVRQDVPSLNIPPFRPFGPAEQPQMTPSRFLTPPTMAQVNQPQPLTAQQQTIGSLALEASRRLFPERPNFNVPFPNSNLPVDRSISPPPMFNVPERPVSGSNGPILPERRGRVPLFTIPPRPLSPPLFNAAEQESNQQPPAGGRADPVFHVPRPMMQMEPPSPPAVPDEPAPLPSLVPGRSANAARRIRFDDMPVPIKVAAIPFPMSFLQAPPQGQERSSPVPVKIPFLNVHDADEKDDDDDEMKLEDEDDSVENVPHRPSFFERLLDSLKPIRSQKPPTLPIANEEKLSQSTTTTEAPSSVTATAQPTISIKVVGPKSRQLSDVVGDVPSAQPIGLRLPIIPPNFQNLRIPIILRPEERTSRVMKDDAIVMPQEDGEQKENIDNIQPR